MDLHQEYKTKLDSITAEETKNLQALKQQTETLQPIAVGAFVAGGVMAAIAGVMFALPAKQPLPAKSQTPPGKQKTSLLFVD